MIPLIAALLLAASPPDPIAIDGLRVIPPVGLAGEPAINARQEDFDNDGHAELLFDDHVLRWPYGPDQRINFPDHPDNTRFEVFQKRLYAIESENVTQFSLTAEGQWQQDNSWSISQLPDPFATTFPGDIPNTYLFDTDRDGTPELIHLSESSIWVFSLDEADVYAATTSFVEWPPSHAGPLRNQSLWPASLRRLRAPGQTGRHRVLLEDSGLSIVSRTITSNNKALYSTTQRPWHDPSAEPNRQTFPAMSALAQPIRLNQEDSIHFAVGRWLSAESSALPIPIYESAVSLDGGATFERRRVRALRQGGTRTNFIDIDNDGDHDWIMTEPDTFDRGQRDALSQFLTREALNLRIQIFIQDAGTFSQEAHLTATVSIDLGKPPVRNSAQFQRYIENRIYSLTGDLNGDGRKDLVLRTHEKRLAIYMARNDRYGSRPDATLDLDANEEVAIVDIDQNGYADIIRTSVEGDKDTTLVHFLDGRWP